VATAGEIINDALQMSGVIGVGQTPLADNTSLGLRLLNQMVGQWNRKRWLIYRLVDTSFAMTGAQSYTVGAGGNFNIARPDRLEAAYFRQTALPPNEQVDYPLQILESREDYSRISLKQLNSFGYYIWYDANYPLGSVYPWPILSNQYELHILTKAVLSTLATLATSVALPPEYEAALLWNLAFRLRAAFQLPPDETVTAMAKDSLNVIRGANAQIPRLSMPAAVSNRGSIFNIYSDSEGVGRP
jgi:hypothetical protein